MSKAIISGATGAIGTALINKLVEENVSVLVLCRAESKRKNNIPSHPLVTIIDCSLENMHELKNALGEKYDVFYHFAWNGTFGSDRNDMRLQLDNIRYTLDAVELAKRFGCELFIGAGSQAEYGRSNDKLKSSTPAFPENGYGIAKLCAGQMSRELAHQLGIKHIWTRILSVYGPNDSEKTMVSSTISKLMSGEIPKMTKGEQIWDFLFSYDAAEAMYAIWKNGKDGSTYCIGSGDAKPLKEYVEIIREMVNPKAKVEYGAVPYNKKQVMCLSVDSSELTEDTGFITKYSFDEGINILIQKQFGEKNEENKRTDSCI